VTVTRHFPEVNPEAISGLEDSTLADTTIRAYLQAEYRIHADVPFSLRVGSCSEGLHTLYARTGTRSSAFITPYNPLGHLLSDHENELKLQDLNSRLDRLGLTYLPAEGLDPQGEWPPEKGVLVLGLSFEQACEIGREFRQNGVLWCDEHADVSLVLLV
jgi:hypothetical protein